MTHGSLETLRQIFDDHVISRGLWPPCSSDLTPYDFYLWGCLKAKVCKTNPSLWEKYKMTSAAKFEQFPGKNSEC
jgi:hypothetical protein